VSENTPDPSRSTDFKKLFELLNEFDFAIRLVATMLVGANGMLDLISFVG
jgi:hypothetical protein